MATRVPGIIQACRMETASDADARQEGPGGGDEWEGRAGTRRQTQAGASMDGGARSSAPLVPGRHLSLRITSSFFPSGAAPFPCVSRSSPFILYSTTVLRTVQNTATTMTAARLGQHEVPDPSRPAVRQVHLGSTPQLKQTVSCATRRPAQLSRAPQTPVPTRPDLCQRARASHTARPLSDNQGQSFRSPFIVR